MPIPDFEGFPDFDYREPMPKNPAPPNIFKPDKPGAIVPYQPPTPPAPTPPTPPAPTPPTPPARSIPRTRPLTGGRIAGGFRMPPGSGSAAAKAGGRGLLRAVPYLGAALLAYDAYQLACYFGLLPGSICPRPDNPLPGGSGVANFKGGQCVCQVYLVEVTVSPTFIPGNICYGPIRGCRVIYNPRTNGNFDAFVQVLCRGTYDNGFSPCLAELTWVNITFQPNIPDLGQGQITLVRDRFGGADNCGDLQPQPQPQQPPDQITNITNITNKPPDIVIKLPNLRFPQPFPRRAPRVVNPPSPLPDITINFNDYNEGDQIDIEFNFNPQPQINTGDQIDIDINFPPTPSPYPIAPAPTPPPAPAPPPAPRPVPRPELPPPIPDTLPPDATDSDKYNFRLGIEILNKLYRLNGEVLDIQRTLEKQGKVLDNLQNLLDFEVEGSQLIKRCDDIDFFYSYKDKALKGINKQLDQVKQIEQTIISEICEIESSNVLASPESWAVRLRVHVPQIALVFRVVGKRTYHKLVVPHPKSFAKLTSPPIEEYLKGNWQVEVLCVDNSKFIANCKTKQEAERIGLLGHSLIDQQWAGETPNLYIAERRGNNTVLQEEMIATSAMFFPDGQKQTVPLWRVSFTNYP